MPSTGDLKQVLLVAAGVIVAGMIINWGYRSDFAPLVYAAGGFDQ